VALVLVAIGIFVLALTGKLPLEGLIFSPLGVIGFAVFIFAFIFMALAQLRHMAHGKGTSHHKLHTFVGWGLIIGLPFAVCCAICAIRMGTAEAPSSGFITWLSHPAGALGLLAFATAAIWYVARTKEFRIVL